MSKKKNKKDIQRAKRKKKNYKPKSARAHLLNKLQKSKYLSGRMRVVDAPGEEKMSEVILDFAKPLLDSCNDDNELIKKAISMAIIVWNITLLPDKDQDNAIQDISSKLSPSQNASDYVTMMSYIDMLKERKKKYFSNNKRAIVNYHFSIVQEGFHLEVASTLSP